MDSSGLYSNKAEECMKSANKKLKGSFFNNIMSSKEERAEEALELFKQAATNYKLAKCWNEAAKAYLQCVECDNLSKSGQAADFYLEAANMKERVNTAGNNQSKLECIKFLQMAISLYISRNRLENVARTQKKIAQIYEKDCQFTLASKYYKEAAEKYSLQNNQVSNYNSCMLKVVDIGVNSQMIDYAELIKILQSVAEKYLQSKLTAPSAKDLYFKSLLLFLANNDSIGASQALERYLSNDPTFYQTRQQKFCAGLIKSVKEANLALFSEQWQKIQQNSYKFNEIIPLDKWKTTVLTKVKETIPQEAIPNQSKHSSQQNVPSDDDQL